MEISFSTPSWKSKIEKWKYFWLKELDLKLQTRFKELESAPNLLDIHKIPYLRLHKLLWKQRMYELAIDISWKINPNRIVFKCLDWEDISTDWPNLNKIKTITKIEITQIWNYH